MRLLHTSDWHLGQNFYGKSRKNEHQAFLDWLLKQIEQQQIDALIVAGDLFDTGAPPSYAREMLNQFVVKLQAQHCQLVLLGGNHDSVAMLNESKDVFTCLNSHLIANVQSNPHEQVFTLIDKTGKPAAQCCAIPFIRPRDVLTSHSNKDEQSQKPDLLSAITQHYQNIYAAAQTKNEQLEQNLPIIGTGHLTVVNASTSDSVRDIYIGTLEAFPASQFPNFDYLALGHIHQAQTIADKPHWRYSGSPIAMSFDESHREKSVVFVELIAQQAAQVEVWPIPNFQPILCLTGDLAQIELQLKQQFKNSNSTQVAWLDLEIDNADFHSDVQKQAEQICQEYPVEILLVRRKRQHKQAGFSQHEKLSLDEIDPSQVFKQKLIEQDINEQQTQKLSTLFAQTVEQIQSPLDEPEA